jgi:hypothetical protein
MYQYMLYGGLCAVQELTLDLKAHTWSIKDETDHVSNTNLGNKCKALYARGEPKKIPDMLFRRNNQRILGPTLTREDLHVLAPSSSTSSRP